MKPYSVLFFRSFLIWILLAFTSCSHLPDGLTPLLVNTLTKNIAPVLSEMQLDESRLTLDYAENGQLTQSSFYDPDNYDSFGGKMKFFSYNDEGQIEKMAYNVHRRAHTVHILTYNEDHTIHKEEVKHYDQSCGTCPVTEQVWEHVYRYDSFRNVRGIHTYLNGSLLSLSAYSYKNLALQEMQYKDPEGKVLMTATFRNDYRNSLYLTSDYFKFLSNREIFENLNGSHLRYSGSTDSYKLFASDLGNSTGISTRYPEKTYTSSIKYRYSKEWFPVSATYASDLPEHHYFQGLNKSILFKYL
jgi:hypothetical protein